MRFSIHTVHPQGIHYTGEQVPRTITIFGPLKDKNLIVSARLQVFHRSFYSSDNLGTHKFKAHLYEEDIILYQGSLNLVSKQKETWNFNIRLPLRSLTTDSVSEAQKNSVHLPWSKEQEELPPSVLTYKYFRSSFVDYLIRAQVTRSQRKGCCKMSVRKIFLCVRHRPQPTLLAGYVFAERKEEILLRTEPRSLTETLLCKRKSVTAVITVQARIPERMELNQCTSLWLEVFHEKGKEGGLILSPPEVRVLSVKHEIKANTWTRQPSGMTFLMQEKTTRSNRGSVRLVEGQAVDFGAALDVRLKEIKKAHSFRGLYVSRTYESKTTLVVQVGGRKHTLMFGVDDLLVVPATARAANGPVKYQWY